MMGMRVCKTTLTTWVRLHEVSKFWSLPLFNQWCLETDSDDTIPDFITLSPPHVTVPDIAGGDEIPESGSSFARAFPGIQPHPVVDMSRARVSPKLKGFVATIVLKT